MSDQVLDPLRRLARLHGVLPVYRDGFKRFRDASQETLLAVLRELGVDIDRPEQAAERLMADRIERWSRLAPPTAVVWGDDPLRLNLHLPAGFEGDVAWELMREDGERQFGERRVEDLLQVGCVRLHGRKLYSFRLELHEMPAGRHRLRIAAGADAAETHVIAAPKHCHLPDQKGLWGVFLPLYALRTERDWGAGDFADLQALSDWTRSLGGSVVGTLPLLAAFLDDPFEYSPYVPASRLFWNELYLDLGEAPPQAAELRQASLVDYRRVAALKRSALESRLTSVDSADLEAYLQGSAPSSKPMRASGR
ncbi:MAG: 4-alpha-glucanotransferase [Bryobacterales bacterium]